MPEQRTSIQRNSSIELLKLIAMLTIVLSHVAQTVGSANTQIPFDANISSMDPTIIILQLLRYFGSIGNNLFFICSAWFLVDKEKIKAEKIASLWGNTWTISALLLIGFFIAGISVSYKSALTHLFPTLLRNNWYITCYLLFYPITPALNSLIKGMTKRKFLSVNLVLTFLYVVIPLVKTDLLYNSNLVRFIVIYFLVAYCKLYLMNTISKPKVNWIMLLVGIIGIVAIQLSIDFFGSHIPVVGRLIGSHAIHFNNNSSPFVLLVAFSLFNIFRLNSWFSKCINDLASVTVFVYLLHENNLVRTHLRPFVIETLACRFGYQNIVVIIISFAIILYLACLLLGVLYKASISVLVDKLCYKLQSVISKYHDKIVSKIEKLG